MSEPRIARLPDGSTLQFPVGTSDEVMDRTVSAHIAGQARDGRARRANSGVLGYIDSLGRQAAQGATYGAMDEVSAALNTGGGLWGNYGEELADQRARDATFRADNPIASTVATVAGGIASPALVALRGAGQGASWIQRVLRSAPSRGVVAGATGGAAAGFGEGEGGLVPRAANAVTDGATGAALGGVLGAGVAATRAIGGPVLHGLGLRNPEVAADRHLSRAFARDRVDMADLAQASPQTANALVDRGGRNVANLGATAANTPSEAMEVADRFVQARRAGRPDRIAGLVDETLGGGGGTRIIDDMDALRDMRSAQAAPLYERAANIRVPGTLLDALEPITSQPIAQRAIARGLSVMESEGLAAYARSVRERAPDPRLLFNPEDVGAVRGEGGGWVLQGRMQNLRLLDAFKRGLDAIIEDGRDRVTGRLTLTDETRPLNDLRAQFRGTLTDRFPAYAQALDAWSGPTALMDGLNLGQRALRLNPDQVSIATRAMQSPGEMEAARVGLGRAITDATSDPARAVGATRRIVEDAQMQRRLEALTPDAAMRERLIAGLRNEANMGQIEQTVSPRAGSQTARMLAGGEDMARDPPGGVTAALLSGQLSSAMRQGAGQVYRVSQGINNATADALASRVFQTDPELQRRALVQALERQAADARRQQLMGGALRRTVQGVAVGQADGDQP